MDNWLRSNNIIRVVAVMVGILLWVIVRLDVQNTTGPTQPTTVSQKYTGVEIQVEGLDENRYTLRSIEPKTVSLTLIGTGSALSKVKIGDYKVVLDLSEALPGETLMSLKKVGFPSNVEVVLDPPNVSVVLDEKERKEVPVTINTIGSPADGFSAGTPIVQPNRVNVTVTSSLSDEVASVVGLVDIEGAEASVKQQVKLVALNVDGAELDLDITPAVVDVEVPITSPFKTMPLQVTLEGATPSGLAVGAFEQSASEVTLYGQQAFLNSLEFYDGLEIDLSLLRETKTFEFNIPLQTGVERVEPSTVSVKVTIVEAVPQTLADVPIMLNGMSDDYTYKIVSPETKEIDVSVEAAPEIIANLKVSDVKAVVDVSNIPPGVYEVPVNVSLPSFVEKGPDNPAAVMVEVTAKSEEASAEPEVPADGGASADAGAG
jgi:YbbR domain-containing protein